MDIKELLNRIEENGFEAYIVGGYVRDSLLGIESNDIDICTNAKVKDLLDIFNDINVSSNEYGSVKIINNSFNIDITTYRRDVYYNSTHKPAEIEYVDNLVEDVQRRDFTINAICMNKDGQYIDLLNGKEDLENKLIKSVGNPLDRIIEDPLRCLRAVRFATVLGFDIDKELWEVMESQKKLIANLSMDRIKGEITKILVSKNALRGLELLKELGYLEIVGISFNDVKYVSDICGMYSQLEFNDSFPFSKEEKDNIQGIKRVVEKGIITKKEIYEEGLYICCVAADILGISKDIVTSLEHSLDIRRVKDIDITSDEICSLLGIEVGKTIGIVYNDLKELILNDNIKNDNLLLRDYISTNRKRWLDE